MCDYNKITEKKRFTFYCLFAFGSTLLCTLTLYLVDIIPGVPEEYQPKLGNQKCWVRSDRLIEFLYVYIPSMAISFIDVILYLWTAFNINKIQKEMSGIKNCQKHSNIDANKDR